MAIRIRAHRAFGWAAAWALVASFACAASAAEPRSYGYYGGTGRKVSIPKSALDPDADFLHVSGSVYYGMVASNFLNWGAHGQGTLVVAPALELQGSGMLNLPGSNISLLRVEASMYLAIPYLATADYIVGSGYTGTGTYVEYVPVRDAKRKKFGLDGGVFFDRHESKQSWANGPLDSQYARYTETHAPVTSVAAFGGFKWVHQTRIEGIERLVFYLHAIYALRQSVTVDLPPGAVEAPLAKYGGRAGTEFSGRGSLFCKLELGIFPSVRGPDPSMFLMLGWKPDVQGMLGLGSD
jgi:hypothetical protein